MSCSSLHLIGRISLAKFLIIFLAHIAALFHEDFRPDDTRRWFQNVIDGVVYGFDYID